MKKPSSINNKTKSAFTLAEVLITLAIIGVVAALTIPSLMQSTQDQEFKTAWKKDFATLSLAWMSIVADNGGTAVGAFTNDSAGSELLKDAFVPKLNVVKICSGTPLRGGTGNGAITDGCWDSVNSINYRYGKPTTPPSDEQLPGVILNNGAFVLIKNNSTNCSDSAGDYYKCGRLWVDVNGAKGPNTWGRDIFGANLTSNAVIPKGAKGYVDPSITCIDSTDVTNTGKGCSSLYLQQ